MLLLQPQSLILNPCSQAGLLAKHQLLHELPSPLPQGELGIYHKLMKHTRS